MMVKWFSALRVEILESGRRVRLTDPFIVRMNDGRTYSVPAGFETDFASVPRMFWRVLPPWGKYSPAAVLHDYLYGKRIGTRDIADKIFLEVMEMLNVPAWKRYPMYWGVRAFGWMIWKRKAK